MIEFHCCCVEVFYCTSENFLSQPLKFRVLQEMLAWTQLFFKLRAINLVGVFARIGFCSLNKKASEDECFCVVGKPKSMETFQTNVYTSRKHLVLERCVLLAILKNNSFWALTDKLGRLVQYRILTDYFILWRTLPPQQNPFLGGEQVRIVWEQLPFFSANLIPIVSMTTPFDLNCNHISSEHKLLRGIGVHEMMVLSFDLSN